MKDRENIMNETKKRNLFYVLVAAVIAVVFFFAGFGVGRATGKSVEESTLEVPSFESNGGLLISIGEKESGMKVENKQIRREEYDAYGVSSTAETAYTVTATVSGNGLTLNQKNVTWSAAAFMNPSSEWAMGKTVNEYISTNVQGNQITISCLKPFGEQIVITCTSIFNQTVSKDLTLDYKEKIVFEGVNIDGKDITKNIISVHMSSSHNASVGAIFSHSEAFTIKGDIVTAKLDFKPTDDAHIYLSGDVDQFMEYSTTVTSDSTEGIYNDFLDIKWRDSLFLLDSFDRQNFSSILQNLESSYDLLGGGWYFYTMVVTLSNSDSPIDLGWGLTIEIDGDSVLDWANNFLSTSLDFDEPYSDGNLIY